MTTTPDDWPPDDTAAGHVRRFARAVIACTEFAGPFLPPRWRQALASWTRRLLALAAFVYTVC